MIALITTHAPLKQQDNSYIRTSAVYTATSFKFLCLVFIKVSLPRVYLSFSASCLFKFLYLLVLYRYTRTEPFLSISVDVRNHENLTDSLDEFVKVTIVTKITMVTQVGTSILFSSRS